MQIYSTYKRYSIFSKRAFTLVELVVVVAIATVVMTSIIIQQTKWSDRLIVNTQSYELALMIRQAQTYSLGVREYMAGTGDKFDLGYGLYFNQGTLDRYIFFADANKNQKYDVGEVMETKLLTRGVVINRVCGATRCMPSGGPLNNVSISFFRPETRANIALLNNGGSSVDVPPVTIYLRSSGGKEYSVKVEANGQVSISQT